MTVSKPWRRSVYGGLLAALIGSGTAAWAQATTPAEGAEGTAPAVETDESRPSPSADTTSAPESRWQGELRARGDLRRANPAGPLSLARSLAPEVGGPPETDGLGTELELRRSWRQGPLRLSTQFELQASHDRHGAGHSRTRVDELAVSGDHGAWQSTLGRKVVSWDVGQAFRPNDLVQQEARRTLLPGSLQGRPLLQIEHFGSETAHALVWVNPHHLNSDEDAARGPEESALLVRSYRRVADGRADAYAFARQGRHSGTSLGAALAWVDDEALEIHASGRWMQHHDGWRGPEAEGASLVGTSPWLIETQGPSGQALLGLSWTGEDRQSVLVEAWWDGTAPSDAQWRRWTRRNQALAASVATPGLPVSALAGNLAWQAQPQAGVLGAPALRRENLFLRLAWQPGAWTASVDAWITPADGGRALTASLAWQGDRLKLQAAWRQLGGPADAVLAQLPTRRSAALLAGWSF